MLVNHLFSAEERYPMKTSSKSTRVHGNRRARSAKTGKPKKGSRVFKKALAGALLAEKPLGNPRVLAIAPEGTRILKPRGKPISFSVSRLKRAIAAATSEG